MVSSDEKEDWRLQYSNKEYMLGALPAMVAEARERVGQPVYVISAVDFYDLIVKHVSGANSSASAVLIESAATDLERDSDPSKWSKEAFEALMENLRESGYHVQHSAIVAASSAADCFVSRSTIYSLGSYEEARSLNRFSLPARRVMLGLVEEGLLSESAQEPLIAKYDGPGRTIGYQVPVEFSSFIGGVENKLEVLRGIATALDLEPPTLGRGAIEPRSFLVECALALGLAAEHAPQMSRSDIGRWIVERGGRTWTHSHESTGGTITLAGLELIREVVTELSL